MEDKGIALTQVFNCDEDKGIALTQVFNCDETGLYWRLMPWKTLVSAREKDAKGFKKPKDRVTLMACANVTGSIKLPLVFIHKSANPLPEIADRKKPASKGSASLYLPPNTLSIIQPMDQGVLETIKYISTSVTYCCACYMKNLPLICFVRR